LLQFGQITKKSKPKHSLKVSQATLAEMLGTTRARVSKFMNGFKKKGFVRYNGSLQITGHLLASCKVAHVRSRKRVDPMRKKLGPITPVYFFLPSRRVFSSTTAWHADAP
jgi:hypothetical protein